MNNKNQIPPPLPPLPVLVYNKDGYKIYKTSGKYDLFKDNNYIGVCNKKLTNILNTKLKEKRYREEILRTLNNPELVFKLGIIYIYKVKNEYNKNEYHHIEGTYKYKIKTYKKYKLFINLLDNKIKKKRKTPERPKKRPELIYNSSGFFIYKENDKKRYFINGKEILK